MLAGRQASRPAARQPGRQAGRQPGSQASPSECTGVPKPGVEALGAQKPTIPQLLRRPQTLLAR